MDTLAQLFGSAVKVKLMRLFLFGGDTAFSLAETARRVNATSGEVRKELARLIAAGLVKKRSVVREIHPKKSKGEARKVHDLGYSLDHKFLYLPALKNLLITASLHADESLIRKVSGVGKVKLLIVSGVFIQEWDTRVDLLLAGDDINLAKLEAVMKNIEADIGKEIVYSAFETEDFEYRLGIHDKLIRDVLDTPHTILINKISL